MSDPVEQPDPIWFAALHRAHMWSDLNACGQDEKPDDLRETPRGCLLGCGLDYRSGDATGLKATVTHLLGQSVSLESILLEARDARHCYPTAVQVHGVATVPLVGALGRSSLSINESGWDIPRLVCADCGHGFHPDSSPHMDRCWECAERDDEEFDR